MRFIFRTIVLMGLLSIGISFVWHNLRSREDDLATPFSHVAASTGAGLRQILPDALPSFGGGTVHAGSTGESIFFSPTDDLERIDIGLIRQAHTSIVVAMYAFTDQSIAQALAEKARQGVKVWVYRDRSQFTQETMHGSRVMKILAGQPNIEVRIKGSNELMHDKVMLIDHSTLRGGSGNWSVSAARYQDNEVTVTHSPEQIAAFQRGFTAMWNRRDNEAAQ